MLIYRLFISNHARTRATYKYKYKYKYSVAGVTGARAGLPADLKNFVGRVRAATDKPLSVGFGISSKEQVQEVAGVADGVVVGSAFMNAVDEVNM